MNCTSFFFLILSIRHENYDSIIAARDHFVSWQPIIIRDPVCHWMIRAWYTHFSLSKLSLLLLLYSIPVGARRNPMTKWDSEKESVYPKETLCPFDISLRGLEWIDSKKKKEPPFCLVLRSCFSLITWVASHVIKQHCLYQKAKSYPIVIRL